MDISGKISAAICTLLICSSIALAATSATAKGFSELTGRFAGRISGPALTSFGANQESYIFEITSGPRLQYVILTYKFLLYEPLLPDVFDYSQLYTFKAKRDEQCGQSIEEISKRYIFDADGKFLEVKYGIEYSKNAPPLNLPWKTRLPCYRLNPQTVNLIH